MDVNVRIMQELLPSELVRLGWLSLTGFYMDVNVRVMQELLPSELVRVYLNHFRRLLACMLLSKSMLYFLTVSLSLAMTSLMCCEPDEVLCT